MSTTWFNKEDKGDAYRTTTLIRLALRVQLGRNQWLPPPTIIVCDARLEFLGTCYGCRLGIGHDIDDRNTIESDHLLEIDIPAGIAVHVRYRRTKVRPVPVRLEEITPVRSRRLGRRHMQEDRIGARLEDGVRLFIYRWLSKCERECKHAYMLFWSHRGGELASGKDAAVQRDLQVKRALHGQILRAHHTRQSLYPDNLEKRRTSATMRYSENLANPTISSNIFVRFL
jgi:hypothetical protein